MTAPAEDELVRVDDLDAFEARVRKGFAAVEQPVLLGLVAEVRRARDPFDREAVRRRSLERLAQAVDRDDPASALLWCQLSREL